VPALPYNPKGWGGATEGVGGGSKAWGTRAALRATLITSDPLPKRCPLEMSSGMLQTIFKASFIASSAPEVLSIQLSLALLKDRMLRMGG
jgi:hypothetical protein